MNILLHPSSPATIFPPPAHDSLAAVPNVKLPRNSPLCIVASSTSKSKPKKQTNDYHSTLNALNSRGRFPRKSLGQHYMLNDSVNQELVVAGSVKEGDIVLEIRS